MSFCSQKYPKKDKKIAGVIIFHQKTGKILLLVKNNNKLDLPKGHVEPNESFLDAALRECEEETGLHPNKGNLEIYPTFISLPSKSWLRFYLGRTNETRIEVSDEHQGYGWATPDEAVDLFGDNNHFSQIVEAMYILSYC